MQKILNCQHLFFDLDHTLWDFSRNSTETLMEMYEEFEIGRIGNVSETDFLEAFSHTNSYLWNRYNKSEIDKDFIRKERFNLIFQRLSIDASDFPDSLGTIYLERCPTKPHLISHTLEVLEYLQGKYHLHILTNGFADTQQVKLERSGIASYFQTVVHSESTGHKKPDKEIFAHALKVANAELASSIMIGDSLQADILGAKKFGMRSIFYNPHKLDHFQLIDYEINHLSELIELL